MILFNFCIFFPLSFIFSVFCSYNVSFLIFYSAMCKIPVKKGYFSSQFSYCNLHLYKLDLGLLISVSFFFLSQLSSTIINILLICVNSNLSVLVLVQFLFLFYILFSLFLVSFFACLVIFNLYVLSFLVGCHML
jgi:hypothetical protein